MLSALQQRGSATDPPPTVVTTSLVHKELHVVPIRLVFYCTPRSRKHAPPSSADAPLNPLIHPLNNPLCPVVCQATVLSNGKYQSKKIDSGFGLRSRRESSRANDQTEIGDDGDESSIHPSLFEELEAVRGSSWQYELQQLKFANQRLQEEVQAIEARIRAGAGSSSTTISTGALTDTTFKYPYSSSTVVQPQTQTQSHYTSLIQSTFATSLPSGRPPNSLHEQDPPPSGWSSLAGANGQGTNPRKRQWRSDDSRTT